MKIAIVGYGTQGKSAYAYWREDNQITICDQNPLTNAPSDVTLKIGDDHLKNLHEFDMIVRSPIVHPREIVAANDASILDKVTTNTNEFFKVCPTKNIIGVTGTKGKGTTSTLIARMLEATGKRVHLGGNIGIPPLELLKDAITSEDWVVLELANFQLIDLRYSPHISVCLMVEPEHQDWHDGVDEYYQAKSQMFVHQAPDDIAIFYADNEKSHTIASKSSGAKIPYFTVPGALVQDDTIIIDEQSICKTSDLLLLGEHNWQNVCAAITAVWQINRDAEAIRNTLLAFSGLPFRIELRAEKHKISYYNDSFATGPGATIAAVKAIPQPKVMIIGGYDRGLGLHDLATAIIDPDNKVSKVLLIGASAGRMAEALRTRDFINYRISDSHTMPEIVAEATSLAKPGEAVVLSPSFASFDMFKNFEDRGVKFNDAVESLA